MSTSHFDAFADTYDGHLARALSPSGENREYFAAGRIAWLKRCIDALELPVQVILDYGCGDGSSTPRLLAELRARKAIGLDISAKFVDRASNRSSDAVGFQCASGFNASGEFDLAYASGLFHHIAPADRACAVRRIRRALRPGGLCSIWENNPWSLPARYVMSRCAFDADAQMMTAHEARRLLQAAGFKVLRTDYLFIFPRRLRALRWCEAFLHGLPLGAQYQVLAQVPKVTETNR